jgi:hypothetical protein
MGTYGGERAIRRVNTLVKSGKLPRASTLICVDCGGKAQVYEHRDYNKPEQVEPVCQSCNVKRGPAIPLFDGTEIFILKISRKVSDLHFYMFLNRKAPDLEIFLRNKLKQLSEKGTEAMYTLQQCINHVQQLDDQPLPLQDTQINMRINSAVKDKAEQICKNHGVPLSAFLRKCCENLAKDYLDAKG